MKFKALIIGFMLMVFSGMAFGAEYVTVRGKVVDTGGNPIAGITIYAKTLGWRYDSQVEGSAVTDSSGRFEYHTTPKPLASLLLVAYTDGKWLGWTQCDVDSRFVALGSVLRPVTLTVSKPGLCRGRVTYESGKPVAGAVVSHGTLVEKGFARLTPTIPARWLENVVKLDSSITDSNGNYALNNVPGNCVAHPSVEKGDYFVSNSDNNGHVVLSRGGTIVGRLVDESGNGIAGARLSLSPVLLLRTGGGELIGVTESDGSYRLSGIMPGDCRVWCMLQGEDGIRRPIKDLLVKPGAVTKVHDYTCKSPVYVTGCVVDAETGSPIVGEYVTTQSMSGMGGVAVSDSDGCYKVTAFPGETAIYPIGGAPAYLLDDAAGLMRPVIVPASGLNGQTFGLAQCKTAKGRVVDQSGKPISGALISANWMFSRPAPVVSDSDGSFQLPVPRDARHRYDTVQLYAEDLPSGSGALQSIARIELLKSGVTLELQHSHEMKVTVRDQGGKPIKDAWVSASFWAYPAATCLTDEQGVAKITGLFARGEYRIEVSRDNYYSYWDDDLVRIPVGGNLAMAKEVVLDSVQSAKGRVIDENGRPVSGATVTTWNAWQPNETKSGTDGRFTIGIPSKDRLSFNPSNRKEGVEFLVSSQDFDSGCVVFADRESLLHKGIVLNLRPAKKLIVQVIDSSGKVLDDVDMRIESQYGASTMLDSTDCGIDGTHVYGPIYSGASYTIKSVVKPGYYYADSSEWLPDAGSAQWKDKVTIVMQSANRSQKGTVVDENGNPVAGAEVSSGRWVPSSAITDGKGEFTLQGLPDTEVQIGVTKGDSSGSATVSKYSGPVTIELQKTAR